MRKGGFRPEDARETGVPVLTSPLNARSRRLLPGPSWPLTETRKVGNPMFPSRAESPDNCRAQGWGWNRTEDGGRLASPVHTRCRWRREPSPELPVVRLAVPGSSPCPARPAFVSLGALYPRGSSNVSPTREPRPGMCLPLPCPFISHGHAEPPRPPPGSCPPPPPPPRLPRTQLARCALGMSPELSRSCSHITVPTCVRARATPSRCPYSQLSHSPHNVDHDTQCQLTTCVCPSAQPPEPLLSKVISLHLVPCSSPVLGSICRCRCQQ